MRSRIKLLFIILGIVLVLGVIFIIWQSNKRIKIPDNPNLKISIDYFSTPSSIETYYFYDYNIIKSSYTGGVLASGVSSSNNITKYYFKNQLDLNELIEFLNKFPKDESGRVAITLKDGTSYTINDKNSTEDGHINGILSPTHAEVFGEIIKIIDNSYKEENIKKF